MSFLDINLDNVEEPKAAAAGFYHLQITQCEVAKTGEKSKNPGSPQFKVSLAFTDEPNVPNITHYVSLPAPGDEPKSANFKALMLKRFLEQFNIPYQSGGIDLEMMAMEMVGRGANAEVELSEPDSNGNVYNRLKVQRLAAR